jgi:putative DNA primase/helicase
MTLVARTAPKPLFISSGSAAFITRSIELHHPTVLCDEFDAVTKGDPEKGETIRALINSVFNREGSTQGKCIVTDAGPVPRLFSTWSPVWLAGIKAVPRTIEDRAVHIALRRKLPSDKVKRLRLKDGPEFTVFRRKAARFAADNEQQLRDIEPPSPVELEEVGDRG